MSSAIKDNKQSGVDIIPKTSLSSLECERPALDTRYKDPKLERAICRKLDFTILPVLAIVYLFNGLDKSNISNAKTDTIMEDLNISGNQWNLLLSIFYIPFVLCAFPLSFVVKKFNPARMIPIFMFGFGSITALLATTALYKTNGFVLLLIGRLFLGAFESAILPSIIFYLSRWYRRAELATRVANFYSAAALANAFSGLLAYGLFQVENSVLHGWQLLFLVELAGTLVFAVVAFLVLPRSIEQTSIFTEEEREYAKYRIETDSKSVTADKAPFKESLKVFKHPVYWIWLLVEVCIGVPLNSINNWFPQIVQNLGHPTTAQTNLYTVGPNVWGAVALIFFAIGSDYFKIRSLFVCAAVISTLIGFVVYGCVDTLNHIPVAYFACFLMTTGASASSVLTSSWYTNNTPSESRKLAMASIGIPLANAAGLISTNIFRAKDAPKYVPALGITAGFGGLAVVLILSLYTFMVFDNRRRNRLQGVDLTFEDVPTADLADGPHNPNFRWMY